MTVSLRAPAPPDSVLVGTSLALIGIGAIMAGSASIGVADEDVGEPLFYFVQHLGALAIGLAGMLLAIKTPLEWWHRLASLMLTGAFAVLILVLLPGIGDTVNGARRWLDIGPIGFQASELARFMLLMYLASYSVRHRETLAAGLAGFLRPMVLVGLASLLLLLEPDFGATAVLMATSLGLLFVAGARLRDLSAAALAAGATFAALIWFEPYRLDRLLSWLNPWEDALDSGYQLVNSFIAIGSGTWFGVGLGQGVQKMHYLPEPHTDFVFAVLAEEVGLIGATVVIVLFSILVFRAFELGRRALAAEQTFNALLAIGIGLSLGLQAAISIGVNTGLLPTKGLTLPLISFGRTSIVVTLFALGLLLRVAREIENPPLPRRKRAEA
jgi:cell division protein FtsW